MKFINEKPFSHFCRFGTEFRSTRCDFAEGVEIRNRPRNIHEFVSDVAEMIGYHAVAIHGQLNGFRGYDCIYWS